MVFLRPMNSNEYNQFLDYAISNYAEEKVKAGNYASNDAYQLAEQEYQQLLPLGLDTPNNYLLMIEDQEQGYTVGFVWLSLQQQGLLRYLTVVNILIYESFQRRGYGQQTFARVEELARSMGISRITLQVFGHNSGAQSLYSRLGFAPTNIYMAKQLG